MNDIKPSQNMKAICVIRTSTDRQRIEEQRNEVIQMAHADGFTDENIEIIGKCGASAIKLDDAYLENLNHLYKRIEEGGVSVVYAWAIDRIGRNEEVLMRLKNTLIKNKIQLVIKNPSLTLLNSDGTVNSGVEIAFSLFATMAKQEMEQKKQRFHRGKKQNAEAGKFNGGTVPFGYSTDERGFYILHPEEAPNVALAFELMATNKYTVATLTNELRARGVMYNGRLITYQFVVAMLKNSAYKGLRNKYAFNKVYPRIVSDELWDAVQAVKAGNNSTKTKAKKGIHLAALLVKCPDCGRSYIAHAGKYVCSGYNSPSIRTVMGQNKCENNIIVREKHLDGALWEITKRLHAERNTKNKMEIKEEALANLKVLEKKIEASYKRQQELTERYERIEDVYIDGRMTKAKYDKQIAAVKQDEADLKVEIRGYGDEYYKWEHILFTLQDPEEDIIENLNEITEERKYDLVHQYISNVTLSRTTIGERKGVEIGITDHKGRTTTLTYVPNYRFSEKKVFEKDKNGELIPLDYELK